METSDIRPRLAVVISHPIQYYSPWFAYICRVSPVDLRVFYLSDHGVTPSSDDEFGQTITWDRDLLEGYAYEFIPNEARRPNVSRFSGLNNPALRKRLLAFHPTAILLFGYAYFTHLKLLLRPVAPIIFRGDSHLLGGPPASGLKRWLLTIIFSRCAAFLPVGTANAAYFRHFGVPPHKLFPAPHSVDASHFVANTARLGSAAEQRSILHIPEDAPVALFSGKLIPKKRPDLLLAAFIRASVPGAHLVIAGEGELLPALRSAAGSRPDIHFLPFANQSAMPVRYLVGDVYVLPSEGRYETWGLAVNESMLMGRSVIVSDHVGCHADLMVAGKTGWVFRAGDEVDLSDRLRDALELGRVELNARGQLAAQHVAQFDYGAATSGLEAALKAVEPKSRS